VVNNNLGLHPISRRFQVIADYCPNLRFRQGTYSFRENLKTLDHEIWPQETRIIALSCGAKFISTSWTI